MIGLFKIFDSHLHFYSNNYFKLLIRQKLNRVDINTELRMMATKGHFEVPGEDPLLLAKRWIDMLNKWKLERALLIASIPGDEDSVAKSIEAYPDRFSGLFVIDPNSNLLLANATKRLKEDHFKGIVLYPSLYQIGVQDEWLYPLYNLLQDHRALMMVSFGKLILRVREYASMPLNPIVDYSNPLDLIPIAKKFPGITFIIPNFGAGKFEETLSVGKECPNVYVDTAGSNSWIQEHPLKPDMRTVFQKFLEAFGSRRILFGSDSGLLPRGYRYDIVDSQLKLLQEMRIPTTDIKKIFYENLAQLIDQQ